MQRNMQTTTVTDVVNLRIPDSLSNNAFEEAVLSKSPIDPSVAVQHLYSTSVTLNSWTTDACCPDAMKRV